jgi:3-oxoacyl-ACP reductase-like protein
VVDTTSAMEATRADHVREAVAIAFRGHMTGIGSAPGEWARWVDSVLDPHVPWEQVLASTVRGAIGWAAGHTDLTYRRLSRRAAASPGIVFPGLRTPKPSVAVVVDTSGSMDDGLLAQALGEVDGVLRSLGPAAGALTVLSCDAAVHTVERSTSARDIRLVGGGGTDVSPGIVAATMLRPAPEVVVVLTDGWTPVAGRATGALRRRRRRPGPRCRGTAADAGLDATRGVRARLSSGSARLGPPPPDSHRGDLRDDPFPALFDLSGKRAVVTGGTRGIGMMIARGLLDAGASVVISSRKAEAVDAAVDQLRPHGDVSGIAADLSREDEAVRLAARSAGRCTCWSTTRAPPGARPSRPSRSRRGTSWWPSTSRARSS